MGVGRKFKGRIRRFRAWWPVWLAFGGAALVFALVALREDDVDQGVAGPLVAVSVVASLVGLATGVGEGFVQPPSPIELRIQMVLVVVALVVAATLRGGPVVAGLAALTGAGAALGLRWCGRRVMLAMLGRDDGDEL